MSIWRAAKAKRVYAALLRLGCTLKKQVGSHRKLQRAGWPNFTFCFHDKEEVGRAALLTALGQLQPTDFLPMFLGAVSHDFSCFSACRRQQKS